MLDGLESVPWARLTCTAGTAEAVPGWLPALQPAAHWLNILLVSVGEATLVLLSVR